MRGQRSSQTDEDRTCPQGRGHCSTERMGCLHISRDTARRAVMTVVKRIDPRSFGLVLHDTPSVRTSCDQAGEPDAHPSSVRASRDLQSSHMRDHDPFERVRDRRRDLIVGALHVKPVLCTRFQVMDGFLLGQPGFPAASLPESCSFYCLIPLRNSTIEQKSIHRLLARAGDRLRMQ